MAASSPSLSNNSFSSVVTPHKTQRGLNKPNCIQCGNVARSRCPFQSCKGCCSTAENPCPIHVLKVATTSAEKTQAPSTPSSEQKATEGTPGMARKRAETATEPSKEIKARGKLSRANKCMKTQLLLHLLKLKKCLSLIFISFESVEDVQSALNAMNGVVFGFGLVLRKLKEKSCNFSMNLFLIM